MSYDVTGCSAWSCKNMLRRPLWGLLPRWSSSLAERRTRYRSLLRQNDSPQGVGGRKRGCGTVIGLVLHSQGELRLILVLFGSWRRFPLWPPQVACAMPPPRSPSRGAVAGAWPSRSPRRNRRYQKSHGASQLRMASCGFENRCPWVRIPSLFPRPRGRVPPRKPFRRPSWIVRSLKRPTCPESSDPV